MAGLRAVYGRGLSSYCRKLTYSASSCENSAVLSDLSVEHEEDPEAEIPLVPKHRDPHAVLKALSSTLTPLPHPLLMKGLSLADPMAPRTRALQMEYQRAWEAGRKAAQYVIKRWPGMFPEADTPPEGQSPQGDSEEALKELITRKETGAALKLYQKLREKGDPVSLETQNGLLELLAYYGNPWRAGGEGSGGESEDGELGEGVEVGEMVAEREEGSLELDQLGEELGKTGGKEATAYLTREEAGEERNIKNTTHLLQFHEMHRSPGSGVWSMENHAERFFAEMPEKDGCTYDALILGLVKFGKFERAWEVFKEMREGNHQASVATYNCLLYVTGNSSIIDPWDRAMSLVQEMKKEPVVQPTITTMSLLLELSAQTGEAKQLSLKTFRETLHLGLEPTLTTFLALLRAHIQTSDGAVLYEITDYLEKNQHILRVVDTQDIFFFTQAMETARNMLDHKLAIRLRRLCDRDNWILCQNLTFFICYYLATITGRVPLEKLMEEYHRFVPRVVLPREWVYGMMFRACEEQNNATFALDLWNHVMRYHVKLSNVSTFSRFSGAMSKTVFPSEVDEWVTALMEAWHKCQELNLPPPPVMIAQIIRLYCMKNDLDKAWEYFLRFAEYDCKPTFQALVSLAKAYSSIGDGEKTVQLLTTMIEYDMVLPNAFVRDLCWKAGVSEGVRNDLKQQFSKCASSKTNPEMSKLTDSDQ